MRNRFESRLFAAFVGLFAGFYATATAQPGTWAIRDGGEFTDMVQDIAVDDAGYAYVTGYFTDTTHFGTGEYPGAGGADVFVAKYTPQGQLDWIKTMGWSSNEFGRTIQWDGTDGLFVGMEFQDSTIVGDDTLYTYFPGGNFDIVLVKFDTAGNYLWNRKTKGSGSDFVRSMDVDDQGSVYFAGKFRSNLFLGEGPVFDTLFQFTSPGKEDIFFAKYDNDGLLQWGRRAGGFYFDGATGIDVEQDSAIVVCGIYQDTCYFGPADQMELNRGREDAFVMKYDDSGNFQWALTFGATGVELPNAIVQDAARNIYVAGVFDSSMTLQTGTYVPAGGNDAFLLKLSPTGNLLWMRQFGGAGYDGIRGLSMSPNGNLLLTGYYQDTAFFGNFTLRAADADQNAFAAACNSNGDIVWIADGKGINVQEGVAVAADANDNAVVTGSFMETCTWNMRTLTSAGSDDLFLIRVNSSGSVNVQEAADAGLHLEAWPNPAADLIHLRLRSDLTAPIQVQILDQMGRSVRMSDTRTVVAGTALELEQSLEGLAAGVYFLTATQGDARTSLRISVMH